MTSPFHKSNQERYAFSIGEIAQISGLTESDCPYPADAPLRENWMQGFRYSQHFDKMNRAHEADQRQTAD